MATDGRLASAARLLGAVALWLVGLVHLHEYLGLYSAIPTIGPLFLLSFVGATATALGLIAPVERVLGRFGGRAVVVLALVGIGQAATQLVLLAISERRPLFGFQEPGYDPRALLEARVTEVATVVLLTAFLLARWRHRRAVAAVPADASGRGRQLAGR